MHKAGKMGDAEEVDEVHFAAPGGTVVGGLVIVIVPFLLPGTAVLLTQHHEECKPVHFAGIALCHKRGS